MQATQCVFDLGRLLLLVSVIVQAVVFSAHIADVRGDSKCYAMSLVALPMLAVSWRYFAGPKSDGVDRPKFLWLAYALTVVVLQVLVFAITDIGTHDSTLLYAANAFTPVLFLLCIVSGCEQSFRDAGFVVTSSVTIFNAFDATEAYIAVAGIEKTVPSSFWGALVGIASAMLVWSALEFTIRSQLTNRQVTSGVVASGLHAVHLILNAVLFSLRIALYLNGWMEFSVMIVKNAMVFVVRLVYMLTVVFAAPQPPPSKPMTFLTPTAPPPMTQVIDSNGYPERPPTPLPARSVQSDSRPNQCEAYLYPALPRHVHFEDDVIPQ